jgi:hypothetical protein
MTITMRPSLSITVYNKTDLPFFYKKHIYFTEITGGLSKARYFRFQNIRDFNIKNIRVTNLTYFNERHGFLDYIKNKA